MRCSARDDRWSSRSGITAARCCAGWFSTASPRRPRRSVSPSARTTRAVDISIDPGEDTKLLQQNQHRVLEQAGQGLAKPLTRDAWPFWLSSADGGAAARTLADAVGFRYKYDPTSKQFAHEAVAFVLTPDGVISRYLYGVDYPVRDFRMALVEASGGKVGTSLDKVILSCYRYDPVTRRYGPFVYGFMRIGAGLVFLVLAGLMTVLWRKEFAMRKRRVAVAATSGRTT